MSKPTSVYINIAQFTWQVAKVLRGEPKEVVEWLTNFCDGLTGTQGVSELADSLLHETNEYKRRDRERKRPSEKKDELQQEPQAKVEPSVPKEPKPKAEKLLINNSEFEHFWSAYPRKVGKQYALKAWMKAKPSIGVVLKALEAQKANWNDPQFIPHPTKWINRKDWEMQVDVIKKEPVQKSTVEFFLEAGYGSRGLN